MDDKALEFTPEQRLLIYKRAKNILQISAEVHNFSKVKDSTYSLCLNLWYACDDLARSTEDRTYLTLGGLDMLGDKKLLPELYRHKPKKLWKKTGYWWNPTSYKKRIEVLEKVIKELDDDSHK